MDVRLTYDGKSRNGVSHIYKHSERGNITVVVYVPTSDTERPPLTLDIPDWWINNTGPRT